MRQLYTIFLLILLIFLTASSQAFCAIKGGIEYSIPVYYDNISETELAEKGKVPYFNALKLKDGEVNEDMTLALNIYSILQNKNPENVDYPVRLGILYDKIGKDRYAKGELSRAIGIDSKRPEPYFYFGEYYYKRQMYRKALKYYQRAFESGYGLNYDTLFKIGDIYEKLGDSRTALQYLKDASAQSPNSELDSKIQRIEAFNSANNEYYRGRE